ncbi:MAG: MoxR family ATPase [Planctomycetes bacterium]|nr:MoxR family ATPase [Planctomycetota bacterium]
MKEARPLVNTEHAAASSPTEPPARDRERVDLLHRSHEELLRRIEEVIVGQRAVIDLLLTALFSGGHAILVGVPGLAKTLLVSTLARGLSLAFRRIQFTPDLMPSDITGTDLVQEDPETGERSFRFVKGPVFTNLLLADEINRTPPKTQAALLEAMQEEHVTVGERTLPLPRPFLVVATQNPIEQEGTYRLPEAQLDRFLFAIRVPYPSEEEELEIMKRGRPRPGEDAPGVLSGDEILRIQDLVPRVPIAEHVLRFALRLVRMTRPEEDVAPASIRECVSLGVGPRAAQYLILAAKARALLRGRFHVAVEDVEAVAFPVLAHRLVTNFHAAAEGISSEDLVRQLLSAASRPAGGRRG